MTVWHSVFHRCGPSQLLFTLLSPICIAPRGCKIPRIVKSTAPSRWRVIVHSDRRASASLRAASAASQSGSQIQYSVPRTPYHLPFTVYRLPCTPYPLLPCTPYPVPCTTLYSVPRTPYPLPSTLYPVLCTLYRVPRTLYPYPVPCTVPPPTAYWPIPGPARLGNAGGPAGLTATAGALPSAASRRAPGPAGLTARLARRRSPTAAAGTARWLAEPCRSESAMHSSCWARAYRAPVVQPPESLATTGTPHGQSVAGPLARVLASLADS
jgi:hypothetical protein